MNSQPPIILLVYANDRVDPSRHLRNLSAEIGLIRDALQPAERAGLCQVQIEANASAGRVLNVFQDDRYRGRISVFHYAGHAYGYRLLLESATGQPPVDQGTDQGAAHAAGLAAFLGEQRGLELVFLNGCSTAPQVQALLDAGCPAVIATSQAIDDRVAAEFASFFYQGLGGGAGLASAFKAAVAATRTTHGDSPRGLYWGGASEPTPLAERWPWDFHTKPGAERAQHWNLPEAADDPLFGLPGLPRLDLPDSPFRHLSWFDREHAEVFFGRAFQVRELYDRITAPDAPPILLFYGQSGVGKSSVLAAGLLPRLEASHRVHYLRRDPALGLFGTLMQPLGASVDGPGAAWHQAETAAGVPLLLILDQVDEVFTRPAADPAEELDTLLAGLHAIFGQPQTRPRGRLILSFRKEWLPEIEALLEGQRLPHIHLYLKGLDRRGIVAAVEGPTRGERLQDAFGLQIDPGLAAEIADNLLTDSASPVAPTLQILLSKLWKEARQQNFENPRFTRDLYLTLKRNGILLTDFLDQQIAALEQWRPEVVQSGLALDLLAMHTTPFGTSEQHTEQELSTAYPQEHGTLSGLLQRCKDTYLLADIPSARQVSVKGTRLAHDTLAPLVRARFDESDKPGQRARRILENRAVEWYGGERGTLLDEADLAMVEAGCAGMRARNDDEHRLIETSRQARKERRKARQRLKVLAWVGLLAIVSAAVFAGWQWWRAERQRSTAERQERIAVARLEASQAVAAREKHPIRALLLAAESVKRPFEADGIRLGGPESLLRKLMASTGGIPMSEGFALDFDPQGRVFATGGLDGTVHLWDLKHPETEARRLQGHGSRISRLAFDPKARWLATGSEGGTVRIWDLADPTAEPRVLHGHESEVLIFAFDPNGRWLATGSEGGAVRMWELADAAAEPRVLRGHESEVRSLVFDPKGRWLAAGSGDGTARVWDLADPAAEPRVLRGCKSNKSESRLLRVGDESNQCEVRSLAFDPKGRWLATGSPDSTARLWKLDEAEAEPRVLSGQSDGVIALAFDPQGHWFAAAYDAGVREAVHLWDLNQPDVAPRLLKADSGIRTFAFDPQGLWLATGSEDGTARLWDLQKPEVAPRVLRGHDNAIRILAMDPQGRWLASGSVDGTTRLWDRQNPEPEPLVLTDAASEVAKIALFSHSRWLITLAPAVTPELWSFDNPKNTPPVPGEDEDQDKILAFNRQLGWLVRGGSDGSMRLWDLQHPEAKPRLLRGSDSSELLVAFDPQGLWLATRTTDKSLHLFDLQHPASEPRVLNGVGGDVVAVAFDPQGLWLATGSEDGTARLWDLQHPESEPRVLFGHKSAVMNLGFDHNGSWLASGGVIDNILLVWNLQYLEVEPRVLRGHDSRINAFAFDPQGRWIATGGSDDTARLWDLHRAESAPQVMFGHEREVRSLAFDPEGQWVATGDGEGSVRLWNPKQPEAEPLVLGAHTVAISHLTFDSEGRWLAAAGYLESDVRIWRLEVHALLDLACKVAGRNLSLEEWHQHVGDALYQTTCPMFPTKPYPPRNLRPKLPSVSGLRIKFGD